MNPPTHLCLNKTEPDNNFSSDEAVYRRRTGNQQNLPPKDYFSALRSDDFRVGLSVNRSKYCPDPNDVLWTCLEKADTCEECTYELRSGTVIKCIVSGLGQTENDYSPYCKHTPMMCNYSHCDILFRPPTGGLEVADLPKNRLRDLKLLLATFFEEV